MKKYFSAFFLLLFFCVSVGAQKKFHAYAVGFYNLENLFDTCHDAGKNDYQFLPSGSYKWNGMKYSHKLHNMARALADMGTDKLPRRGLLSDWRVGSGKRPLPYRPVCPA